MIKLSQYLDLDVFLRVEFEYVTQIVVSFLFEADARYWYPLNRVEQEMLKPGEISPVVGRLSMYVN